MVSNNVYLWPILFFFSLLVNVWSSVWTRHGNFFSYFFGEIGKGKWKRGTNTPKVITDINHIVSKLNHSCTFWKEKQTNKQKKTKKLTFSLWCSHSSKSCSLLITCWGKKALFAGFSHVLVVEWCSLKVSYRERYDALKKLPWSRACATSCFFIIYLQHPFLSRQHATLWAREPISFHFFSNSGKEVASHIFNPPSSPDLSRGSKGGTFSRGLE